MVDLKMFKLNIDVFRVIFRNECHKNLVKIMHIHDLPLEIQIQDLRSIMRTQALDH